MAVYSTEITSEEITSDNPIHQRLLKAYYAVESLVSGDILEIGCGEGRGVDLIAPLGKSYVAVDKIGPVIQELQSKYPELKFIQMRLPPLEGLVDESYDTIVSFQVIEHIKKDKYYLEEIYRLLKPGGKAIISTPNKNYSLTRNPWHIREYVPQELIDLCSPVFDRVEAWGIKGSQKVMDYHERNRESVKRITRWDILNLQYRLPRFILRIPYEILNRLNRNKLEKADDQLVSSINQQDYVLDKDPSKCLDLFYVLHKA